MNNLNNLLTGLMDTVSKAVSNGKNIDDIASELGVDKEWVKMIINNQSDSEQKVLDAIKKDTSLKISNKKDLSEISGVSLNRIDDILEKLLKLRKVSFSALWSRGILPDNKPNVMIKTFLRYYIHELCKGLSDTNKDIVKNNIDEIMKEFEGVKKEEYKQLELLPELPDTPAPEMKPVEVSLKTKSWNEVEVNTLSYMIEHGYSIEKMANVLGKDVDVVREKRYVLISSGLVNAKNNVIETKAEESKPESAVERYVPTKGRAWTTAEIEKLKTMLAEGKTSVEIAVALNRPSRQTIDQKIYNLRKEGILPPAKRNVESAKPAKRSTPSITWSDKEIELITKLTETGCVPEDIAQILGKSPTDVSNMIDHLSKTKKITLPPPEVTRTTLPFTRTWSAEEEEKVISMRREGHTIRAIAEALGRSYTQVNGKVSHLREAKRL